MRISPTYIKYECHCFASKSGFANMIIPMMDCTLFEMPEHVITSHPMILSIPTMKAKKLRCFSLAMM